MRGPSFRLHATFGTAWLSVIAAFAVLTAQVDGTYYLSFDRRPAIEVQSLEDERWADALFRAANFAGTPLMIGPAAAASVALLAWRRRWLETALVAGTTAMWAAKTTLRETVDRPFSWETPPDGVRVFPNADSFPSGHVTGEVLVYGLIFWLAPRMLPWRPAYWGVRALCAGIIVAGAPARLYVGAHWPSDLMGGALLAAIYLIPALWADAALRRRGATSLERYAGWEPDAPAARSRAATHAAEGR